MDYMKVIGKNKYQTNFYIQQNLESIRAIGFIGHNLPDNELLLMMIAYYTYIIHNDAMVQVIESYHLTQPKRKDGSEHWLEATLLDGTK